MALKIRDDFADSRMIEMYKWVLTQDGIFRFGECPKYKPDSINFMAVNMLTARRLIKEVGSNTPKSYRVDRIVDIYDCLAPFDSPSSMPSVKRYRVPPSVARSMGGSPNLEQYAI